MAFRKNNANTNTAGVGLTSGCMHTFDKLPKAVRRALAEADHNWSGEQLYTAWKRRKLPGLRNSEDMIRAIRENDAKVHFKTATETSGIMPGQRGLGV
ncbi:DUF6525 family protein [Bradyrhizobium sp. CCGB20]|uniref:DUF6525 family protein n=1 Tax=Bradyrhizobium sp. CCGB20 TaxID=2949633 RepID=UPI0020B36DD0|nr:DUF6525 family protein [Bradyrhizobium sp. CCGB20]MCP3400389.1 DUF6525 family protein [Bradyrhizobium sp. CCGB20]